MTTRAKGRMVTTNLPFSFRMKTSRLKKKRWASASKSQASNCEISAAIVTCSLKVMMMT